MYNITPIVGNFPSFTYSAMAIRIENHYFFRFYDDNKLKGSGNKSFVCLRISLHQITINQTKYDMHAYKKRYNNIIFYAELI